MNDAILKRQQQRIMNRTEIKKSRRYWIRTVTRALLTGWRRPVDVVKSLDNLSAAKIFLVHCIAVAGFFVVLSILEGLGKAVRREKLLAWPMYVLDNLANLVDQIFTSSLIELFQVALGIEIVVIAMAVLLTPWCARDEPMPQSLGASIHRLWAHSLIVPAMLLLYCTPVVIMLSTSFKYRFDNEYAIYREALPWYIDVIDAFITVAFSASVVAYLVSLFRAVAAPRQIAPPARNPQCDQCGYSLIGTADDGNCPECGLPVADSIGPHARSSHDWKNRKQIGRLRAWWRAGFTPFSTRNPNLRRLSISGNDRTFQSYLAVHLVALVLIVFLAQLPRALANKPGILFTSRGFEDAVINTWLVLLFFLFLILASALFTAFVDAVRYKQNLAAFAMQASAYQSFYLLWMTIIAITTVFLLNLGEKTLLIGIAATTGIKHSEVDPLILGFIAAGTTASFLYGVFRATAAARYASR